MAKNDLFFIDGIIENYISQELPSRDPGEVFEYFASEQILKQYEFTKEQIQSGNVDGRNDGGIDDFFIIVNGHLADSIPDEFWPKSSANLEIYIFTCKHDDSFKQQPITTLIPSLIELLDFRKTTQELTSSYNTKLLLKRELLIKSYKRLATMLSDFRIHLVYACRGNENLIEDNIRIKAEQAKEICQESFSDSLVDFFFCGCETLLKKYRKNKVYCLELNFEQYLSLNGQYVVLSKLSEYYKFISDSDGLIKKYIFDMNVRDYLGLNPVNEDIIKTLNNPEESDFWWLNNGITIIGSDAHIVGNTISVENVQIVNGLQTSESIYKYLSETGNIDNRSILIKIIISKNEETVKKIIYATNNQTNVNVVELYANEVVQKNIDDVLKAHEIYYDRRPNTYQNKGIPDEKIISPLLLASAYICLIYKSPFIASGLKQRFMRNSQKYNLVFSEDVDIQIWYKLALLTKKTELFLKEKRPRNSSNMQSKFYKKYRPLIMFLSVAKILGTYSFGINDVVSFNLDLYTKEIMDDIYTELNNIFGEQVCQPKRISSKTYYDIYNYFSELYNIKNVKCIYPISKKLWNVSSKVNNQLTEDIIEKVFFELPEQPWVPGIHIQIAQKLNLSNTIVSNAISYLIYIGRKNYQKYGYVFDNDGYIILEGEHFSFSEQDARNRRESDIINMEMKFGEDSFNH